MYLPLEHSRDIDLIALWEDRILRVQVKTSTVFRNGRYEATLATRGGNRSWSGLVKTFCPTQCDYLFVLTGDGRRWFIPATVVDGGCLIRLGGPKYADYEVEPGDTLEAMAAPRIATLAAAPAGFPSGQRGCAVNAMALPSQVRILPPP
ncbi:MAG: endonuclease [Gaiellaceae bacterium]|nr:endonuclease [Gaiellaceae bacterium]